jgi:hypothetical protein
MTSLRAPDPAPAPAPLPLPPGAEATRRAADDTRQALQRSAEDLERAMSSAIDGFNHLVDRIPWGWLNLSPLAAWAVHDKLESVADHVEELQKRADTFLDHYAPVVAVIDTSFAWLNDVLGPMSALSNPIHEAADQQLAYWEGVAKRSYVDRSGRQETAVGAYADRASKISSWLMAIAKENVAYVTKLADVVAQIAGLITEAAIEAGSVIGALEAVGSLAAAVGSLVKQAVSALIDIANRVMQAISNRRELVDLMSNSAQFPGGRWPQAVRPA